MALNGTLSKEFRTGYVIRIDWSATQDITNNTSTVTSKFYLQSKGSSYTIVSSVAKTLKIIIDGTTYTHSVNVGLSGNQDKLLATSSKTISHASDGTKSFSISGDLDIKVTLGSTYFSTVSLNSTSYTLNTIPRKSTISVFNNFVIGNAIPVTITETSSSFTYTLRMWYGNTFIGEWGNGTTSITLTTAQKNLLYNAMPNSTYGTVTLYCYTYNGGTEIGYTTKTAIATIGSSIAPTFTSITYSEVDLRGAYLQNLSKIKFTFNGASSGQGSTISSYKVELKKGTILIGTYYGNPTTTGTINNNGVITVIGTVTDSRGRTYSNSTTLTLEAYEPPKILSLSVKRCNQDGTINPMGTTVKIDMIAQISPISINNSVFYRISSKVKEDTTFAVRVISATTSETTLNVNYVMGGSSYPVTNSYDFKIEVVDNYNTTYTLNAIGTGEVAICFARNAVGVGKIWEKGGLDVKGDVYINDKLALAEGDWVEYNPTVIGGGGNWTTSSASYRKIGKRVDFCMRMIQSSSSVSTFSSNFTLPFPVTNNTGTYVCPIFIYGVNYGTSYFPIAYIDPSTSYVKARLNYITGQGVTAISFDKLGLGDGMNDIFVISGTYYTD